MLLYSHLGDFLELSSYRIYRKAHFLCAGAFRKVSSLAPHTTMMPNCTYVQLGISVLELDTNLITNYCCVGGVAE